MFIHVCTSFKFQLVVQCLDSNVVLHVVHIDMFTSLLLFCATEVQDSSATAVQQLCNSSTTELEV